MVLRMLTTFAKTSNVSNKPGLTLENAGDYRGALRVPVVETSGGEAGEAVVIYGWGLGVNFLPADEAKIKAWWTQTSDVFCWVFGG